MMFMALLLFRLLIIQIHQHVGFFLGVTFAPQCPGAVPPEPLTDLFRVGERLLITEGASGLISLPVVACLPNCFTLLVWQVAQLLGWPVLAEINFWFHNFLPDSALALPAPCWRYSCNRGSMALVASTLELATIAMLATISCFTENIMVSLF
jgi:hypothetical protein